MFSPRNHFEQPGHFYSPTVNLDDAERDLGRIWPGEPKPPTGIDFNQNEMEHFLSNEFTRYMKEYDYPDDEPSDGRGRIFYNKNPAYGVLDARSLFVMLRTIRPRKMVEVGCGYSTLLTADVNRRFLGGTLDFTCIEPYAYEFLKQGIPGVTRLIETRIQEFSAADLRLGAGDILFIDTSHVSKLGSDVNHIYFEILPNLAPGVLVHIHDIFFPHDYPRSWVLEGRSWNEQYVVQAMLMHSDAFKVRFAGRYAFHYLKDRVADACGGTAYDGCSLWLERTVAGANGGRAGDLASFRMRHLLGAVGQRFAARLRRSLKVGGRAA